jgi:hypothetical protein
MSQSTASDCYRCPIAFMISSAILGILRDCLCRSFSIASLSIICWLLPCEDTICLIFLLSLLHFSAWRSLLVSIRYITFRMFEIYERTKITSVLRLGVKLLSEAFGTGGPGRGCRQWTFYRRTEAGCEFTEVYRRRNESIKGCG